MRRQLVLVLAVCGGSLACDSRSGPTDAPEDDQLSTVTGASSVDLKFAAMSDVSLVVVLSQVERAHMRASANPLSVLAEVKSGYTTSFDVGTSYSSLVAFAADMESQDSNYDWRAMNSGGRAYLVIKPASGGLLDQPVVDFEYSTRTACFILNKLNNVVDSRLAGSGGCIARSAPSFIPAADAASLLTEQISVSLPGNATAEEVALTVMGKLSSPIGLTVYEFDSSMQYFWEVAW